MIGTRGYVRDLPSKAGSVDPDDGFAMRYEAGRRAARTLGAIARALENADGLVLATDLDREGEAIAWQVLDWLEERDAIGDRRVERAAFHKVTEEAVRAALDNPRAVDMDLVVAWQARLALDYLVGYGLVAGAVAQAAGVPLGGPGAVGGAAPDLRARGRDRGLCAAAVLDRGGRSGGEGRRFLRRDAGPAGRNRCGRVGPPDGTQRERGGRAHPGGAVPGGRRRARHPAPAAQPAVRYREPWHRSRSAMCRSRDVRSVLSGTSVSRRGWRRVETGVRQAEAVTHCVTETQRGVWLRRPVQLIDKPGSRERLAVDEGRGCFDAVEMVWKKGIRFG